METLHCPATGEPQAQLVHYYLSSCQGLTAAQALDAVCGYWAIENQLHWHPDVLLTGDAHQLRDKQAVENVCLVRKIALNLLQADPEPGRLKVKRKRLAWNASYLDRL